MDMCCIVGRFVTSMATVVYVCAALAAVLTCFHGIYIAPALYLDSHVTQLRENILVILHS